MSKENIVESGLVSRDAGTPIPLLGSKATAEIVGRGTHVTIAQRFRNIEKQPVEAVYKFPLPEAGAVCGFRAVVGDRRIEGVVEERDEAFKRYDEALAAGHGAYLLDQERPNIFTLSVGNLKPGQEATVELEYVALLPTHGGETRFCLPTTISPRYLPADAPDEEGIKATDKVNPEFALEVPYGLTLSMDILGIEGIESVESPSHKVRQTFGKDRIQVEFTADDVKMDRDFVLTVIRKEGFENRGYAVSGEKDLFLQVDLCPQETDEKAGVEQEIVFVLDCSGSMGGDSIDEARKALTAALGRLEPGSRFNLYRFGSNYEKAFKASVPYTQENLDAAKAWVGRVQADLGGTEMLPPLREIYGEDNKGRTILLITDGQVGNEAPILDLIRDHAPGTRFFTIGIGYGSNEHMLREAARMGNGACEMIAPGERIEHKALRLFGKMMGNSVLDVKIADEGRIDQSPSALVLFTGETASVFGRLKGKASLTLGAVRVTGTMEGNEVSWEIPVSMFTGKDSPVPTLWARESIRDIEEGNSPHFTGGSRQERRKAEKAKKAVVALSKEFGIASSHASIVAIEEREEKDKATGEVVLRKIPVMIPKGWHGMDSRFAEADLAIPISPHPHPPAYMAMRSPIALSSSRMISTFYDEKAPSSSKDDGRTARLMDILACQRAEGGFSLDTKGAKALGISLKVLNDAAKKVFASQGVDGYVLVCTALVFAYLTGPAADLRETWGAVAEKSRKWLAKITKTSAPKVGGETLASWASTVTLNP